MTNTVYENHILNLLAIDPFRFVLLFLLFMVVPSILIAQQDTTPPVLNEFFISPTEIDVTEGYGSVEVLISVSDDLSGLDDIDILFLNPSGEWGYEVSFSDWTSGALSYTGTGILYIDQYAESGEYTLKYFRIRDYDGNLILYYPSDLDTMGFSYSFNVISNEDSLAPEITFFSISPTEIDVTDEDATVEITISVDDNLSGVKHIEVNLESPSGISSTYISSPQISPGTMNYSFSGDAVILQYVEPGVWDVSSIFVEDWNNNSARYLPSDLDIGGFSHTFEVISNQDTLAPELINLDIVPTLIEPISPAGDSINISISVLDYQSGLNWISGLFLHVSGQHSLEFNFYGDLPFGSTEYNGTKTILMTPYRRSGRWDLSWISLTDMQSNNRIYSQQELDSLGFQTSFIYGNQGPVYHVSTTGSDLGGDGSIENPFATIQKGLNSAIDGDTVLVAKGIYTGEGNKNLYLSYDDYPYPPKRLVIISEDGPDSTIIDGEGNVGRGFYFGASVDGDGHDQRTLVKGFTIENCRSNNDGGGMYFSGSTSPVIANCIIRNSVAHGHGGGVFGKGGASPTFINCTIVGNTTEADHGGGISFHGDPVFINCLIADNSAESGGGGLNFQASNPVIINSTIASNTASYHGGIYGFWSDIQISNSIIWGNTSKQIGEADSIIISYSDVMGGRTDIEGGVNWLIGNTSFNPMFINPDTGDYGLQAGSPTINAGNPNPWYNNQDGSINDMGFTGGWLVPSFTNYDFGEIGISKTGVNFMEVEWKLWNTTETPVEITSASFSTDHFSLIDVVLPIIIAPFSSHTFNIRFQPLTTGILSDSLVLEISGLGNRSVEFQGTGISNSTLYGTVNGILTSSGSPYQILDDIEVSEDDSLVIEPGVELRFAGHFKFNVFGLLRAVGTEHDSIVFTRHEATESSKWGGIRFREGDPGSEMAYCRIEYAKADESGWSYDVWGGGLYIGSPAVKISHCKISNNESRKGGGIACFGYSPVIENCLVFNNDGTGIYLNSSTPLIKNCSIYQNDGRGIRIAGASPFLTGVTILENYGGIYIEDDFDFPSSPIFQNCLIVKNSANSRGGAIYCQGDSSKPVFLNCTITGNYLKWGDEGGGIYSIFDSNILLVNTILYNNTPNEIYLHDEYPSNITFAYSNIEGGISGIVGDTSYAIWLDGNIESDPLFVDTANAVYSLNIGSSAIDAGTSLFVWEGDTILNLSPEEYFGSAPDMGAYETYLTAIYAGDTDNNGIVDAMDILPIGVYFQQIGSPRINDGVNWENLSAVVWSDPAATYADANGEGIVDEKDVIAIGVNWGNAHETSSPGYTINLTDTARLQEHQDAFMEIYNSLSGDGEAVRAMKSLLRSILDIQVPETYSLAQNYPNPFNPITTISFGLPEARQVTLTVYNLLGQEVRILVNNEPYDAGMYTVKLDASRFSSGIYFYRLETKEWSAARKMVVVK